MVQVLTEFFEEALTQLYHLQPQFPEAHFVVIFLLLIFIELLIDIKKS